MATDHDRSGATAQSPETTLRAWRSVRKTTASRRTRTSAHACGFRGSVRPDLQGTRSDSAGMRSAPADARVPLGQSSDALLRHRHSPVVVLDVRPRLPRPGEPLIERSSDLVCGLPYLGQVVDV